MFFQKMSSIPTTHPFSQGQPEFELIDLHSTSSPAPTASAVFEVVPPESPAKIQSFIDFMFTQMDAPAKMERNLANLKILGTAQEFENALVAYCAQEQVPLPAVFISAQNAHLTLQPLASQRRQAVPGDALRTPLMEEDHSRAADQDTRSCLSTTLGGVGAATGGLAIGLSAAIECVGYVPETASACVAGLPDRGHTLLHPSEAIKAGSKNAGSDEKTLQLQDRGQTLWSAYSSMGAAYSTTLAALMQANADCYKAIERACPDSISDDDVYENCGESYKDAHPLCLTDSRYDKALTTTDRVFTSAAVVYGAVKVAQYTGLFKSKSPEMESLLSARLGPTHPLVPTLLEALDVQPVQQSRLRKATESVQAAVTATLGPALDYVHGVEHRLLPQLNPLFSEEAIQTAKANSRAPISAQEMNEANMIVNLLTYKASPTPSSLGLAARTAADFGAQWLGWIPLDLVGKTEAQCLKLLKISEKAGPEALDRSITLLEELVLSGNATAASCAISALEKYAQSTFKALQNTPSLVQVAHQAVYADVSANVEKDTLVVWAIHRFSCAQKACSALRDLQDAIVHLKADPDQEAAYPDPVYPSKLLEDRRATTLELTLKGASVSHALVRLGQEFSVVGAGLKLVDTARTVVGATAFFGTDFINKSFQTATGMDPDSQTFKLVASLFSFLIQK